MLNLTSYKKAYRTGILRSEIDYRLQYGLCTFKLNPLQIVENVRNVLCYGNCFDFTSVSLFTYRPLVTLKILNSIGTMFHLGLFNFYLLVGLEFIEFSMRSRLCNKKNQACK